MDSYILFDQEYFKSGISVLGGVDEAGRGALAGPVFVACVAYNRDYQIPKWAQKIQDSKKLNSNTRDELCALIIRSFPAFSCVSVSAKTVDAKNVLRGTMQGMSSSLNKISLKIDKTLIDGNKKPSSLVGDFECLIAGDKKSLAVAAASIVAKSQRDKYMVKADKKWPNYGFARHKGYGTKEHFEKIKKHGPCPIHRLSFYPLSDESFWGQGA